MAICKWCNKDMKQVGTCVESGIEIDNEIYKPILYGQETRANFKSVRCHDCNIEVGGIHHPGCDVEECPICHFQLISCGCLDEDEE